MNMSPEPDADRTRDCRDAITAASLGYVPTLRRSPDRAPSVVWGGPPVPPPLPFAVREGHLDAVRVLLDAGADRDGTGFWGETLIETARDRGFEAIAQSLEEACQRAV